MGGSTRLYLWEVRVHDEEGFGRYVMQAYDGLVRRGVLLVGDRGHAEDLVQVSLSAAYPHWRRIRQPDAYVRTVMVRTAVGWRARQWRRELPTHPLPDGAGPDDPLAGRDLRGAVLLALAALPPEQRAVVVLRYFDDCSESEIASALRCSPGTVKSRASRALASLRAGGLLAEDDAHAAPGPLTETSHDTRPPLRGRAK